MNETRPKPEGMSRVELANIYRERAYSIMDSDPETAQTLLNDATKLIEEMNEEELSLENDVVNIADKQGMTGEARKNFIKDAQRVLRETRPVN